MSRRNRLLMRMVRKLEKAKRPFRCYRSYKDVVISFYIGGARYEMSGVDFAYAEKKPDARGPLAGGECSVSASYVAVIDRKALDAVCGR